MKKDNIITLIEIVIMIALGTGIGLANHFSFLASFGIAWLGFGLYVGIGILVLRINEKRKKKN